MKLNIVMDASGMFYRSLFTVGNFDGKKGEKLLDTKKSQGVFMRKLATDFSSIIREIENPSRVIVCMDSSSWRKTIQIDDGGYKHDREEKKEDSPVNWKVFYELIEKFSVILSQKGYIVSKIPGAEADDLLYLWSRMLNDMGENVILVTGDSPAVIVVAPQPLTSDHERWRPLETLFVCHDLAMGRQGARAPLGDQLLDSRLHLAQPGLHVQLLLQLGRLEQDARRVHARARVGRRHGHCRHGLPRRARHHRGSAQSNPV